MPAKTKDAGWLNPLAAPPLRTPELFHTERPTSGHSGVVARDAVARPAVEPPQRAAHHTPPSLAELYEAEFDFVWRCARRLGVAPLHLDDVVQEVFLVVHRRLADFEGRSSLKGWLYGITRRVARDYRRSAERKPSEPIGSFEPAASASFAADVRLTQEEDARLFHALLAELDEDKREVFMLSELEQLSGPEIAALLGENLNTVYARLRAARSAFELVIARHRARSRRSP